MKTHSVRTVKSLVRISALASVRLVSGFEFDLESTSLNMEKAHKVSDPIVIQMQEIGIPNWSRKL